MLPNEDRWSQISERRKLNPALRRRHQEQIPNIASATEFILNTPFIRSQGLAAMSAHLSLRAKADTTADIKNPSSQFISELSNYLASQAFASFIVFSAIAWVLWAGPTTFVVVAKGFCSTMEQAFVVESRTT
jgi:hypothetical protein